MDKLKNWISENPIKTGLIALIVLGVVLTAAVYTPTPDDQPSAIEQSVNR